MNPRALPGFVLLFAFVCLPAETALFAQSVRGRVTQEIRLEAVQGFEQTVSLRYGEFAAVYLPEQTRFLEGVEIEIALSALLREHYDTFALVIYDDLEPPPRVGGIQFKAHRRYLSYLRSLHRLFYRLTLHAPPDRRDNPALGLFFVPEPVPPDRFPLLVGLSLIMKGVPDSLAQARFYLTFRPIVAGRGLLRLDVRAPTGMEDAAWKLYLDDHPVSTDASHQPLEREMAAGLHTARVESDLFRPLEVSFSIDPGATNTVVLSLEPLSAILRIEAPESAVVYLDGHRQPPEDWANLPLTPGEHTIRFKIGDYSLSKTFTVEEGKRYTVSLELAIGIKEY